MTEPQRRELDALMSLLEDPDMQVFSSVSERLVAMGPVAVSPLERRWELTLKPELQYRIETVIRDIQFKDLSTALVSWRSEGGKDLLMGASLVARTQYPELDYQKLNEVVEKVRRDIWLELNSQLTALEKVRVINYFFYQIHRFDKSLKKAHNPHLYLVNHVIDTRRGSPVLLGLLYAEIARRLDLPVYGVNLPRNFVLCYYDADYQEDPNGILFYINPTDQGSVLGTKELKSFLSKIKVEERPSFFTPCSGVDIIERLLLNLRYIYERSGETDKANQIRLLMDYAS